MARVCACSMIITDMHGAGLHVVFGTKHTKITDLSHSYNLHSSITKGNLSVSKTL